MHQLKPEQAAEQDISCNAALAEIREVITFRFEEPIYLYFHELSINMVFDLRSDANENIDSK